MTYEKALIVVDAQRGFMPASEGERLQMNGFGELGVPEGEQIVAPLNRLLGEAATHGWLVATTQDWHPHETAHFSDEPNFTTTWPRHCVDGTSGAELHPELQLPGTNVRFIKGMEVLEDGADDLSYSGYYAVEPATGHTLPEWLARNHVREVVVGGLALDYCVGRTALDLAAKTEVDVTVALDATRPVAAETSAAMQDEFIRNGIRVATTDEIITLQMAA